MGKHAKNKRFAWCKLHLIIDAKAHEISHDDFADNEALPQFFYSLRLEIIRMPVDSAYEIKAFISFAMLGAVRQIFSVWERVIVGTPPTKWNHEGALELGKLLAPEITIQDGYVSFKQMVDDKVIQYEYNA